MPSAPAAPFPTTPRLVTVMLAGTKTDCANKVLGANSPTTAEQGEKGVKSPKSTVHAPLKQVWPPPHDVPFATLPSATQVAAPEEQEMMPVWQTLPAGLHAAPEAQLTHAPSSQTSLVPHEVPFAALPSAIQVAPPEEHETAPVWHGLVGMHATPGVHELGPVAPTGPVGP